jgi:hypothetical protein
VATNPMSHNGTKVTSRDVRYWSAFGGIVLQNSDVFCRRGFVREFCHNPLFRSGIEPLRHRHLTHDLRRTSVWRQWRWTAKELGEAAQVLRGGGEQYLVPGAAEAPQSKPVEPQDALHVRKSHLDFFAFAA